MKLAAAAAVALAGMLAAGETCTVTSAAASVPVVHVDIHHSRFVPAALSLHARHTVRFVVHNADPIDHEFIVGDQVTQDRHERGTEARHDGSVPGEISVPAGATVSTTYQLGSAGQLLYACHLPGHWAYGMRGVIRIAQESNFSLNRARTWSSASRVG